MSFWKFVGSFLLFNWIYDWFCGDDSDDEDDYKPQMRGRDGSGRRYGRWNDRSYDRFHEEQDDYDMMDEF